MGLVSQAVYDGGRHVLGYHWFSLLSFSLFSLFSLSFIQVGFIFLQSDTKISHAKRGNFFLLFK